MFRVDKSATRTSTWFKVNCYLTNNSDVQTWKGAHSWVYNKVENNISLSNKNNLSLNMNQYYKQSGENVDDNMPLTFLVKGDTKDSEFIKFKQYFELQRQNGQNNQWILKPGEFSNRGKGIKLSQQLSTIENYVETSRRACWVIQKYIHNPLLISNNNNCNRRKFDIRCFALYTCFNGTPKAYFFQDGYLRTASKEFSETNLTNKFIHLTNDAIQKKWSEYGKYESNNKLSFMDFQKYLEKKYPEQFESGEAWFYTSMYPKIKKLVADSFKAVGDRLNSKTRNNWFEMYGYDFMITEDFNVQLIEVNTNPWLETPCSLLSSMMWSVLDNTFRIVLDPYTYSQNGKVQELWDSSNNLCKFELIWEK